MFDLSIGEAIIEEDCVAFDIEWKDDFGKLKTVNVLFAIEEKGELIFVSWMYEGLDFFEINPRIDEITHLSKVDPVLLSAITMKLGTLHHPVADEALRMCR